MGSVSRCLHMQVRQLPGSCGIVCSHPMDAVQRPADGGGRGAVCYCNLRSTGAAGGTCALQLLSCMCAPLR